MDTKVTVHMMVGILLLLDGLLCGLLAILFGPNTLVSAVLAWCCPILGIVGTVKALAEAHK